MVTLVDTSLLLHHYASRDFLRNQGESNGEEDERILIDLMVEQIEFANIIILNKISLMSAADRDIAKKLSAAKVFLAGNAP